MVFTITDVEELGNWIRERFENFGKDAHGDGEALFEKVEVPQDGEEDTWEDKEVGKLVRCIREDTEEGKKVTRNGGTKFVAVFQRKENAKWPDQMES